MPSPTPVVQYQSQPEFRDRSHNQGPAPAAQADKILDASVDNRENDHVCAGKTFRLEYIFIFGQQKEADDNVIEVPMEVAQLGDPDYENEDENEGLRLVYSLRAYTQLIIHRT